MHYFAYGSNLDAADWRRFCGEHGFDPGCLGPSEPALLPDMCLCFDMRSQRRGGGVANVIPATGHLVHGALFRPTAEGWRALDTKEGAPHVYRRRSWRAIRPDGTVVPAQTYEVVAQRREGFVAPGDAYAALIRDGLASRGLPTDALERAIRGQPSRPALDGLFVYGTLMQGESRHPAIARQAPSSVLPASAPGALHATAGDYPAMLPDPDARVRGELMRFADLPALLPALDAVEGFGGYDDPRPMYWRTVLQVALPGGGCTSAWCYVAADADLAGARIPDGDWRAYRRSVER